MNYGENSTSPLKAFSPLIMRFMNSKKLFLLCLLLALTACGGKKNSHTGIEGNTSLSTIYVKGDPKELIKGSTIDKNSFISENNLSDFDDYSLANIWQFTEKEVVIEQEDTGNPETGNEATEEDQTVKEKTYYSFQKKGNEYLYSNPDLKVDLTFTINNGKLELKTLETTYGVYDLNVLHYSQKKSKDAFSILAELQDPTEGRILLSFVFVRKTEQRFIKKVDEHFKYIMGAGIVTPWSQKELVQVDVCGNYSPETERAFRWGITQWKKALDKRMSIKTNFLTLFPPFSDMNTHCIYTVKDYSTEPRPEYRNSATTLPSVDTFKGEIIDSDIMVWVKEIEKDGDIADQTYHLAGVTTHELGHFFGLDHQFDENYSSIMSYSKIRYMTEYDEEAISNLYPLL